MVHYRIRATCEGELYREAARHRPFTLVEPLRQQRVDRAFTNSLVVEARGRPFQSVVAVPYESERRSQPLTTASQLTILRDCVRPDRPERSTSVIFSARLDIKQDGGQEA